METYTSIIVLGGGISVLAARNQISPLSVNKELII
jgi:hypothetical protein